MNKTKSSPPEGKGPASPSQLIDARIEELCDWRGETLARVRILIKQAGPDVVETWKWRGVPVWEHAGIICTGETYKAVVRMTFAKGASLEDPSGLFNASLEGNTRRAIDIHEGDKIDAKALQALIRAAVALNTSVRAPARPIRSHTVEPMNSPVMPEACFQHDPEAEPRPPSRGETVRDLPHGNRLPQIPALRNSRFQRDCWAGMTGGRIGRSVSDWPLSEETKERSRSVAHYGAQLGALAPLIDWTSQMAGFWQAGAIDRLRSSLPSLLDLPQRHLDCSHACARSPERDPGTGTNRL